MKIGQVQNPFEGLDKGDVQVVLASDFFIRLKERIVQKRERVVSDLASLSRSAAAGNIASDHLGTHALTRGAELLALDMVCSLIADGETYARS